MYCWKCGAAIPEGSAECVECFTPAVRRGLWSRVLGWLKPTMNRKTRTTTLVTRSEHVEIVDDRTGERRVYHSIDDVPPDLRARIDAARLGTSGLGEQKIQFTYRDPTGRERTYYGLDEMPPEVREMYERVQREVRRRG